MSPFCRCCLVVSIAALVAMFILPGMWWLAAFVVAIVSACAGAVAVQETDQ